MGFLPANTQVGLYKSTVYGTIESPNRRDL